MRTNLSINKEEKSKATATMVEDEESLPYTTEVDLDGEHVSVTEDAFLANVFSTPERPKPVQRHGDKGYLNETEQALRRMDSQNKGYIDQDKTYLIMDSLLREQKQSEELMDAIRKEHKKSIGLKRGLIAMGCFALLLAVANIGTSFVAVKLIKDMEVSNSNDLVSLNGQRVATTSKQVEFKYAPADASNTRRRRLADDAEKLLCGNGTEGYECVLTGYVDFETSIDMYQEFCNDWPNNENTCQGDGVDAVLLNCNGVRTTVLGGMYLPPHGPETDDFGEPFWVFPSLTGSYTVREVLRTTPIPSNVWGTNNTWGTSVTRSVNPVYCTLEYELALYCPIDNSECAAIATWDLNACPDSNGPLICGTS